ncbi:MAG TPA: cupin domain-containing protein [Acidobacteriaceae bacterium]|nr:cupin domain-containing protein [Acidobacteriaceae bacterium]
MAAEKSFSVLGEQIEILVGGETSGGKSVTFTELVPPGGGPPPHSHQHEDETFFVLEGEFEFTENGRTVERRVGESFHAERGAVHAFRNSGEKNGKLLIFVAPAGIDRFFEDISVLEMPRDVPKLMDIGARYGITFQLPGA